MVHTSLSLLDRLAQRPDPESWQRLVDIYTPLLRSWMQRYDVQQADADDLMQDVLVVVSRELSRFRHNRRPGAFRTWLRTILLNRLREFWRERRHRPSAEGGSDLWQRLNELQDEGSGISRFWNEEHDRHVVRQLLASVRSTVAERTWTAFWLVVMESIGADEAARQTGLTRNEVYVAKSRVLRKLRQEARGLVD